MLTQKIWLGDDLSVVRYDLRYKDTIFPGNTFVEFYDLIKNMDRSDLDDKQQAYIEHFLKIDISNYPELKIPD
jgi:hypothetical protein